MDSIIFDPMKTPEIYCVEEHENKWDNKNKYSFIKINTSYFDIQLLTIFKLLIKGSSFFQLNFHQNKCFIHHWIPKNLVLNFILPSLLKFSSSPEIKYFYWGFYIFSVVPFFMTIWVLFVNWTVYLQFYL
jgi:hypothetical protein